MTRDQWVRGFWARVLKMGAKACWPWLGTLKDGYGQLKRVDGSNVYAHRAAVEIRDGKPIPDGCVVMHTCDNPRCVNPQHLRVGTQRDNVRDMHDKGRAPETNLRGDRHGSTRVSDTDVATIRALWKARAANNVTQEKLAKRYGVSQAQISRIVNGRQRK